MRRRSWNVRFRATPKSDGLDRLGVAVKSVIERGLRYEARWRRSGDEDVGVTDAELHEEGER
jgi:hypothetical protein